MKKRRVKSCLVGGSDKQLVRGPLNNFPDFFRMGTFIDSTHRKL